MRVYVFVCACVSVCVRECVRERVSVYVSSVEKSCLMTLIKNKMAV